MFALISIVSRIKPQTQKIRFINNSQDLHNQHDTFFNFSDDSLDYQQIDFPTLM